jgi:hypothetical protein
MMESCSGGTTIEYVCGDATRLYDYLAMMKAVKTMVLYLT